MAQEPWLEEGWMVDESADSEGGEREREAFEEWCVCVCVCARAHAWVPVCVPACVLACVCK